MKPAVIERRAQALINYKLASGETVSPEWLVSTLEKMGATAHQADQCAAKALASPETAMTIDPTGFAAALRAAADKHDEEGAQ